MGTIINLNERVHNISDNIVLSIDKNNVGEMYIYDGDDPDGYILNGVTASDLVDYFYEENIELAEEILDMVMRVNVINTTN